MEHQCLHEQLTEEMFWLEAIPLNQRAFVPYTNRPINESGFENCGVGSSKNNQNMNKRMMEFLRRNANVKTEKKIEPARERCYRHMISERMRRENQKQSYLALHRLLPFGTKNEKNSIIQTAAVEIQKMERYKEELQRRNLMLEAKVESGGAKIRFKVANPSSGIDSMIEAVKCLKDMGLRITSMHSQLCDLEFSAEVEIIENQVGAEEVEKAVQRALNEVERKHRFYFQEGLGGV